MAPLEAGGFGKEIEDVSGEYAEARPMRKQTIVLALATMLAAQVHGAWTHDASHDDFEGVSRVTASVSVVGEPYRTASFTLRCTDGGTRNSRRIDAYFTFGYLNRSGADDAPLRVKFGDSPPHDWQVAGLAEGRRGLFISDAKTQAERLALVSSFQVRLAYHNEVGPTTISFPMEGALEAIGQVLGSDCGANAQAVMDRHIQRLKDELAYEKAATSCVGHMSLSEWRSCMEERGIELCSVSTPRHRCWQKVAALGNTE